MAEDPLSKFRVPVSPEAPAGEDLTYDEAYLRIREEIDRAGTVSVAVDHEKAIEGGGGASGPGVDYGTLAESVKALLAGPTRDLQLAAYLTFALVRDKGVEGLAEGLEITHALLDAFGQAVHPVKPLRRRNAVQYLADRVKDWMTDRSFTSADSEHLSRAREAAGAIAEWTTREMGDGAPALSGLLQALDEASRVSQRSPKAAETPPAATNGSTPAAPVAAAPAAVVSPGDARRAVWQAAAYLREQDPASPHAYRLARAMAWGGLTTAPPSQSGRTILEAPDPAVRAQLQQLADPGARLRAVEETFTTRPLWLDLQRLGAEAAEQAGAAMAPIRAAIVDETVALLGRVAGLTSLSFADGTPLADAATLGWLDSLPQPGAAVSTTASAGVDEATEEALEAARTKAAAGDTREAVRILRDAPGALAGRARFTRALHMARLCQQGGRLDVATALLDGLVDEAVNRGLTDWEPELAIDCLRLAHSAWSASESTVPAAEQDAARARVRAIYAILCRVDPSAALAIAGGADKKGGRG